ncbi:MAG: NUDIX domain-containing protein [Lachnospiraceae bacterium]|nr:NUDIX domain-containing protein [Lachnospiraceae bacterium]
MAEYWDLYDENKKLLGRTIKRGDALGEGEYYVCCEIWIQNSNGQFLVTQRHPDKKAGGLWEFSGGGVLAGETTKKAAVRELTEELGISVEENELNLLEVYQHKNYFMDIYVVNKDLVIEELILQPEEVVDAKWVSRDELLRMIEDKQVVWSVGVRYQQYSNLLYA